MKTKSLILFFLLPIFLFTQTLDSVFQKITPGDRREGDNFGWSVAVKNDVLVVGSPEIKGRVNSSLLQECGAAYIFLKKDGRWVEHQKIMADKIKESDYFGTSVSVSDYGIAIGASGDDTLSSSDFLNRMGAVYIFSKNKNGEFVKKQKITLPDRKINDNFGHKVFINKNQLLVSAPGRINEKNKTTGTVYLYKLSDKGKWVMSQKFIPSENSIEWFGENIFINDSIILIGVPKSSRAYVYKKNSENEFYLLGSILTPTISIVNFSSSVCAIGNYIFIGAEGEFDHNQKLDFSDSVVINNREKEFIGSGEVLIYEVKDNKISYLKTIKPKDTQSDAHFGMCITNYSDYLLIGAFGDKLKGEPYRNFLYAGAVYLYKFENNDWIQKQKIISPIRTAWDKFGFSVAIDEKTIIVGSRFEKENFQEKKTLNAAGAVYSFLIR